MHFSILCLSVFALSVYCIYGRRIPVTAITTTQTTTTTTTIIIEHNVTEGAVIESDSMQAPGELNVSQTFRTEDEPWVIEAVRDVAYYLRSHKFNEWDRRYRPKSRVPSQYNGFPNPVLRSLHWEVKQNCEPGDFLDCLRYLHRTTMRAPLRRNDDSAYILQRNANLSRNATVSLNIECLATMESDRWGGAPFLGPIERFQWRATASIFLCRFTMLRRPALATFGEPCDNYASCLDPALDYNPHNSDPRAIDKQPFACAEYSFCPDPCCPLRRMKDIEECLSSPLNPCYSVNKSPTRNATCTVLKEQNVDIASMIFNHWNVTCACSGPGYEWRSKYGICVDVDECLQIDTCTRDDLEVCVNTIGNHSCVCRWGYARDLHNVCTESDGSRMLNHDYSDDVGPSLESPLAFADSLVRKFKSGSESVSDNLISSNIWGPIQASIYLYIKKRVFDHFIP